MTAKKELSWLGIDSRHGRYMFGSSGEPVDGVIQPSQTVDIVEHPQVAFTSERLWILRACASKFLIRHVLVGCRVDIPVSTTPIIAEPFAVDFDDLPKVSASLFDEKRPVIQIKIERSAQKFIGAPFKLSRLHVGMTLTFRVENISDEPSRFLGSLQGFAEF